MLGTAGLASRALGRDPQCQNALDLAVLALASFKASRTLARDEVTSWLREPFVRGHAHTGEGEEPVQGGMEQAIGELVTCTRCVGTWAAAGLAATQVLAPRFGRLLTWSLGAAAANDFLQAGFSALTAKANEHEEQAA
jgi:TPP-dependent pyruvate/acetoin dehydrogenase alpha subunit